MKDYKKKGKSLVLKYEMDRCKMARIKKSYYMLMIMIISVCIPLLVEKFYYFNQEFKVKRAILIFFGVFLLGMHLFFLSNEKYKKILDQIFRKRYIIGFVLFIGLVINGFHGSSLSTYNIVIQGNNEVEDGYPIVGTSRNIRSDEWAVSSMFILSQATEINNFSTTNENWMAESKPVNLYLKAPTKDISILGNPSMIFFLVLPIENAFSAYFFFGYFVLFFATFELLMIITKRNRACSFVGAVAVVLAPANQWWDNSNMIAYGEIAVVTFYYFLQTKSLRNKILYSILIGISGSVYIMTLYPAWMIPYGYFFLMIVIWMLYSQKCNYKWSDFLILIPVVLGVIGIIFVPAFLESSEIFKLTSNTVYPGTRLTIGGYGAVGLVDYFTNLFLPINDSINQSEVSQFISLYPLPMLLSLYYIIKNKMNKKFDLLLVLLFVLSLFLGLWNFIELPEIISKMTMMSMSTVERSNVVLSFVNLIMIILCVANYSSLTVKSKKHIFFIISISIIYILIVSWFSVQKYSIYYNTCMLLVTGSTFLLIAILFLINNKKSNNILLTILLVVSVGAGLTVHPLNKGLNVIYEKPISKQIQKIIKKDEKSKWITVNTPIFTPNYIAANGASVINSTNYVPNFDFWGKIDKTKEYEDIYNRYAHLTIKLTKSHTTVNLIQADWIELNLNVNDLRKVDIEYIVTNDELEEFENNVIKFNQIYREDGIAIYRVQYR